MPEPAQVYGYLRVPAEADDDWEFQMELAFIRAALMIGFQYVTTFPERTIGDIVAFGQLVDTLQMTGAHHVFLPTLAHLSPYPLVGKLMAARLRDEAGASLMVMDPTVLPGGRTNPLSARRPVCLTAQRTYFHY